MSAVGLEVTRKIKGRQANSAVTPSEELPAVRFRSKARKATPSVTSGGSMSSSPPLSGCADHSGTADHACAVSAPSPFGAEGHIASVIHDRLAESSLPAPSSVVLAIRELARQRTDLLRAWQRLNNQVKAIEKRGHHDADSPDFCAAPSIAASSAPVLVQCAETALAARKTVEKSLTSLAKSLPVYETFTKPTKGLGALGLALIIGETGDLSLYANPAKVWKRMGLAVIDGARQRKAKGDEEAARRQGYSPHRRQIMWNIGDAIIKVGDTYRQVYLDRKEVERIKTPDGAPILHHRRAQRYMEKRVLRDLWRAWRDLHGVQVVQP